MILAAGTRLGPYEIFAPIGAGGMGEVYRARDTRLSRESGDGRFFLLATLGAPGRVFRVDLLSGARSTWKVLMPSDPSGVFAVGSARFAGDDESYVYTYLRRSADLFLIEGFQ